MGRLQVFHGDCREVMAELEPESVTAIVTDPPYGLSFMGKGWDHGVPGVEFWTAALRVVKPGGMLLAFGGTRTYHRLACAIEDAGWEIRDCLSWLYGSGFPKSLDVSKAIDKAAGADRKVVSEKRSRFKSGPPGSGSSLNVSKYGDTRPTGEDGYQIKVETAPATDLARDWSGYGTALKPAWEPILLAMKPLDGTFAENAERYGVAGLNVDECRVGADGGTRGSNYAKTGLLGIGGKADIVQIDAGRFPANLALDEEAARELDAQSGQQRDGVAVKRNTPKGKKTGRIFKLGNTGVDATFGAGGGASRFFYTAKAGKRDRGRINNHPTVKPEGLMRWLVRMVKMPEGTVILDPFMGSGSTILAANAEKVKSIGIELELDSCKIMRERLLEKADRF